MSSRASDEERVMGGGLSKKRRGGASKQLETVGLSFRALAETHGHVGSKVLRLPVNIEWASAEKVGDSVFVVYV